MRKSATGEDDMQQNTHFSLKISNLLYTPPKDYVVELDKASRRMITSLSSNLTKYIPKKTFKEMSAPLFRVNLDLPSSKITMILGNNSLEQETLLELITNRRCMGSFDGQIVMSGLSKSVYESYNRSIAFVPKVSLKEKKCM